MRMFRASTRVLDHSRVRGSVDQHLDEIEVDRSTDKTVWIRGHRFARFTEHLAFTDSRIGALTWLLDAWKRKAVSYEKQIECYERQIEIYRELIDREYDMVELTRRALKEAQSHDETPDPALGADVHA